MSRRKRKRQGTGTGGWFSRAAVTLLILAVVGSGVLYAILGQYLHSEGFRKLLSSEVSKVAKVDGSFSPFRWEGLAVDTDHFDATGQGMIRSIRAEGLHTEIGLSGITRGVWEIRDSNIRRIEIDIDARHPESTPTTETPAPSSKPSAPTHSWLPKEFEVQGLDLRDILIRAKLDEGDLTASGIQVRVDPTGGKNAYKATVDGGTIRLPSKILPVVHLNRARARYQNDEIFITDASASMFENGRINASGEWNLATKRFAFEGDATGIRCEDLLNESWAKRLTGTVSSSFTLDRLTDKTVARGSLNIENGVLTALPLLDSLAAYADTRRFRILNLNQARTDWRYSQGEITLTDLVLSSEGLVHLEGTLIIKNKQLDGRFRLGLAPGTLASIPGAETDVFIPGERGLLWTPLHITGTLDDPKEDLTDRLIAAAGMRMFDVLPETGEKVLKFTQGVIQDNAPKAIETGVEVIEKTTDVVREASGILGNLIGGQTPPPPAPAPTPAPAPQPPQQEKPVPQD
jgi:hypothetical protein